MRSVQISLFVPGPTAATAYRTLADFDRYPELSDAVRSVVVTPVDDRTTISRWEVSFRAGILRWSEEDIFDPEQHQIVFRQLDGDIAVFEGSWDCADVSDGSEIVFTARLDMGIPTLADALEPIAARTLIDNTVDIARGLFGAKLRVDSTVTTTGDSRAGAASPPLTA